MGTVFWAGNRRLTCGVCHEDVHFDTRGETLILMAHRSRRRTELVSWTACVKEYVPADTPLGDPWDSPPMTRPPLIALLGLDLVAGVELVVLAPCGYQLVVRAALNDPSLLQDDDGVGVADGA